MTPKGNAVKYSSPAKTGVDGKLKNIEKARLPP
jgi:hypothetical protein